MAHHIVTATMAFFIGMLSVLWVQVNFDPQHEHPWRNLFFGVLLGLVILVPAMLLLNWVWPA